MKLQTKVPVPPSPSPIDHDSSLLLLGSCFVTHMGARLHYYQFPMQENPLGILYHPFALQNLVHRSVRELYYTESELFYHGEAWHCYDAHTDMSRATAKALEQALNNALVQTRNALLEGTHLVITLGTAWAYRRKTTREFVANCHKVPQKEFSKELSTGEEVTESLRQLLEDVRAINKNLHCIFTISPVRHLKEGFIGNQRSKAHLVSGLHAFLDHFQEDPGLSYFPAYEILMDELRDYRFYGEDLLHPNTLAVSYVWERFNECHVSPGSREVMKAVGEVRRGLEHRPFNPGSREYREFRTTLDKKIAALRKHFPHMQFDP